MKSVGGLLLAFIGPVVASQRWTYQWPYGLHGECQCRPVPSWGEHESELACLRAFADERYETCRNLADRRNPFGTTTIDTCNHAVSTFPLYDNDACSRMCQDWMRTGENFGFFEAVCQFEFTVVSRTSITLGGDCFSRTVFGHTDDTSAAPGALQGLERGEGSMLRIAIGVASPVKCQSLCQAAPGCLSFIYRALPSPGWDGGPCKANEPLGSAGCPPRTCILLKDTEKTLEAKLAGHADNEGELWQRCHVDEARRAARFRGGMEEGGPVPISMIVEGSCRWKSDFHVSGPRVCIAPPTSASASAASGAAFAGFAGSPVGVRGVGLPGSAAGQPQAAVALLLLLLGVPF